MLQKSIYYPSQEFYWEISFLHCFGSIKDIYLFCNICNSNRTECKPVPISMNSSHSKYTRMIHQYTLHFIVAFRVGWSILSDSGSVFYDSGKFRLGTILEKKSFKLFVALCSSVISSSSSTRVIFSEEIVLLERNGLAIFQKHLLSTTLFVFNDKKYSILAFRRSDTHLFLCFWNKRLFSSLLCFRKRYLILLRIIIASAISALINGLCLAHNYRCFCRAYLFKTSQQIKENAFMPSLSR